MPARHAEDLLWIGRYLERAEDTARLLDVTYHTTLEAGDDAVAADAWADLIEVLYLEEEGSGVERRDIGRLLWPTAATRGPSCRSWDACA